MNVHQLAVDASLNVDGTQMHFSALSVIAVRSNSDDSDDFVSPICFTN